LTIIRQENRILGKRNEPLDDKEVREVQEATSREIIRRRHHSNQSSLKPTLQERRATDKENITKLLKTYSALLTPWSEVMAAALRGRSPTSFEKITDVDDFIDGFLMAAPADMGAGWLQRILKDAGIDVHPPKIRTFPGSFWVQLASGPYELRLLSPKLGRTVEKIRKMKLGVGVDTW